MAARMSTHYTPTRSPYIRRDHERNGGIGPDRARLAAVARGSAPPATIANRRPLTETPARLTASQQSRLQNSRGIGVGAVLSSLGEHDLPWIVDWISCRENRRHAGR